MEPEVGLLNPAAFVSMKGVCGGATRLVVTVAVGLCACVPRATLQAPETVPARKVQTGVGSSLTAFEREVTDEATGESRNTRMYVPSLNAAVRIGVTDRFEVHKQSWLAFGLTLGVKYMVLGDRKDGGFVLSPGFDFGYFSLTFDDEVSHWMDLYFPMHMGYRTSKRFVLYWTPQYILQCRAPSAGSAHPHAYDMPRPARSHRFRVSEIRPLWSSSSPTHIWSS